MMELTILFPCLNEENTVAACVRQAADFLREYSLEGEVLVSDNGSEDASVRLAMKAGARVVHCPDRGYGNALRHGIREAGGKYVILGDCDCSYHFTGEQLLPFLEALRNGGEMVIGDRFLRIPEPGAMPLSHRYLGVPFLSALGRRTFGTTVQDFHCGLRAVRKSSFLVLNCRYTGMEFATEMIGRAALAGQDIRQLPVKLYCDRRGYPSHLRSFRDGMRHLRVIFTRCDCDVF